MCNSLMVEFELINHYILVRRLKFSYAICGEVERWIEYYPNNRYKRYHRGAAHSSMSVDFQLHY